MATSIDVAAYQLSERYPPDKGNTYSFPPEENLWLHSHHAILSEVESMKKALKGVVERRKKVTQSEEKEPLEPWVLDCLQTVWDGHFQYLQAHHEHEEVTVGQVAKKRFKWPEAITTTHEDIDSVLGAINDLMLALRSAVERKNAAEADKALEQLLEKWTTYQADLTAHIQLEEETIVPLVRAYMSHNDMNMLIFKIMSNVPKNELGAIEHYTGEEHIRTVSMPYQRMPQFLWTWLLKPAVEDYRKTIVASADAVRLGIPLPSEPKQKSFFATLFDAIMACIALPATAFQKILVAVTGQPTKLLKKA